MPDLVDRLREGLADVAGDEPIIKLGTTMAKGGAALQDVYRRVRDKVARGLDSTPASSRDRALPKERRKATTSRKVAR